MIFAEAMFVPISWSVKKWCVFLLATIYFWAGGILLVNWATFDDGPARFSHGGPTVWRYYRVHKAYRDDNGLWIHQTGKNTIREMEASNAEQRFRDEEAPMVVSAVEGEGIFLGAVMWHFFNHDTGGNKKRLMKKLDADKSPTRITNSYGGRFEASDRVAFIRMWPEPR